MKDEMDQNIMFWHAQEVRWRCDGAYADRVLRRASSLARRSPRRPRLATISEPPRTRSQHSPGGNARCAQSWRRLGVMI